jgi:hypothetical protein
MKNLPGIGARGAKQNVDTDDVSIALGQSAGEDGEGDQ